jgi:ribosomal protein S18 acetylase RimI-like enzyme
MHERHAATRASMPERPRTQHRLDRARQLEAKAKSLWPRPDQRHQRSRRCESLVLRFARALDRLANQQADAIDLSDARGFVLAWDDGRLVGTIMAGWDGWRASMARLAIDPQYRRIGLARALVERIARELSSLCARRIGAIVLKNNRGGRAFWSSAGYELDREDVRYVKDLPRV